jgi:hypothetical protein
MLMPRVATINSGIYQHPQQAQKTFPASSAWQESSRNVASISPPPAPTTKQILMKLGTQMSSTVISYSWTKQSQLESNKITLHVI